MLNKEKIKQIMLAWRDQTSIAADALMENLFEHADYVLLEYASKAENNNIQAKFSEGQRELWLKKDQLASFFHDNLSRDLFQFMRPAQRSDAPGSETLSLVSKDSYERSLALQTISDQAVKKNQELYYALSQRLGVVTGGRATPFEEIPAGPHQLAAVFESAVQVLAVERQVLLALYTLFEREVIRESPSWHEELNEAFRNCGILPNLKYEVKRDASKERPADTQPKKEDIKPKGQSPRHPGDHRTEYALPKYQGAASNSGQGNHGRNAAPAPAAAAAQSTGTNSVAEPEYDNYGNKIAPGGAGGRKELGDQLLGRIQELLTARRLRQSSARGAATRPDPVNPAPATTVVATIDSPQVQQSVSLPDTGVLQAGVRHVVVPRVLLEKLRLALATQREKIKQTVGDRELSYFDEDTIDIVGMLFEVMLQDNRLNNTVKALLSHLHTPYLKLAVRDRAFLKRIDHPARRLFDNMIEAGSRWVDERDLTRGIYPKLQRVVDAIMKAGSEPLQLLRKLDTELLDEIKRRSKRQQAREVRTLEAEKGKARLDEAREAVGKVAQSFLATTGAPARYQTFIEGPWTDYLTLLYLRSNGDTDSGIWLSALRLCGRLRAFVDGVTSGTRPSSGDLTALRSELEQRLGDAIPHHEAKVQQLFELFSTDHEVTILAPTQAPPESPPPVKVKLSSGGKDLLKRLPQLPPGSWVVFHSRNSADQVVKLSWFNPKTKRFLFVDQVGAKALVVPLQKLADQIDRERAHVLHATDTSYVESSLKRALSNLERHD